MPSQLLPEKVEPSASTADKQQRSNKHLKRLKARAAAKLASLNSSNDPAASGSGSGSGSVTPFRTSEQYWKTRVFVPDLDKAFAVEAVEWESDDEPEGAGTVGDRKGKGKERLGVWRGGGREVAVREVSFDGCCCGDSSSHQGLFTTGSELDEGGRVMTFPDIPGLVLYSSVIPKRTQRDLIRTCLRETTRGPRPFEDPSFHTAEPFSYETTTNLDLHWKVPAEGAWNLYERWRNDSPSASPLDESSTARDLEDETDSPGILRPKREIAPSSSSDQSKTKIHTQRVTIDLPPITTENYTFERASERAKAAQEAAAAVEKCQDMAGEASYEAAPVKPLHVSEAIRRLRWSQLGWEYHWGTKTYFLDRPRLPIPPLIHQVCSGAVKGLDWRSILPASSSSPSPEGSESASFATPVASWGEDYEPQAGVVNFYQLRDSLTAHIDQSEPDAVRPLVSIRSGDMVIMSGPCRRVFHGVPRIFEPEIVEEWLSTRKNEGSRTEDKEGENGARYEASCQEGDRLIDEFMRTTRINVNVRQVFSPTQMYSSSIIA